MIKELILFEVNYVIGAGTCICIEKKCMNYTPGFQTINPIYSEQQTGKYSFPDIKMCTKKCCGGVNYYDKKYLWDDDKYDCVS